MNVPREAREREIIVHILNSQKSSGKDHHVVPFIDSFQDEREPYLAFYVMPLLRDYNLPEFETVSEVLDLFKQLLEVWHSLLWLTWLLRR